MLKTFEQTAALIAENKLLHISGTEALLRKLPQGNWIGGSTEYFLDEGGGLVSDKVLDVMDLNFATYKFASYDTRTLPHIAKDTYDNGFSIIILPFDSDIHKQYARNAVTYSDFFVKTLVGWISGFNLGAADQTPVAVNGSTGEILTDKAAVLHIGLPKDKIVFLNIVNIFKPDMNSPIITFDKEGFEAKTCFLDGRETIFADYITQNKLDTKLPLIADYSDTGLNISIKSLTDGTVNFYAPVFEGLEYRFAEPIPDYVDAFSKETAKIDRSDWVFSCNCILNFLYGELEGKNLGGFYGPITFGEIAWQLLNQTLVYLQIK
jgi:hypothetical protein